MGTVTAASAISNSNEEGVGFIGVHHVGIICKNLEKSLDFYCGVLGMKSCNLRPDESLWFRGAWLWVGSQMIHLMEVPNPDPVTGRPLKGGEDRHMCLHIEHPEQLKAVLNRAGIPYTESMSLKPQIFIRDPDGNGLEFQPLNTVPTAGNK